MKISSIWNARITIFPKFFSSTKSSKCFQLNLIAADDSALFRELGCEWNRNSDDIAQGDVLAKQFDACAAPHGVRAWNGPPNADKASRVARETSLNTSV